MHYSTSPMSESIILLYDLAVLEVSLIRIASAVPDEEAIACCGIFVEVALINVAVRPGVASLALTDVAIEVARVARAVGPDIGTLSVAQIAQKCGYSDIFSFSNAFKKAVGMSPTAYAKDLL